MISCVSVQANNGIISGVVSEDVYPYATIPNFFVVCYNFYSGEYVAMGITQSDGTYQIKLPSGDYKVYAQPKNESMYIPEYYEDTFDSFHAKKINVSDGQTVSQVNFELAIGGLIEGMVLHLFERTPISFMRIEAYGINGNLQGYTTSLDDGRYYLHVPEGKYKLRAYDTRDRNYVTVFYDEGIINNEQVVVINNFDGIDAYIISVKKGYGKGYYDFFIFEGIKVEGIVTGIDQSPVPNAIVWALAISDENQHWTKTQSDGSYEIIVPEASYLFYADSSNYLHQYYQHVYNEVNATVVTVDKTITGIDFQLQINKNDANKLIDVITMLQILSNFSISQLIPLNDYDLNDNHQVDMMDIIQVLDILSKRS
jgi:hypothetical protein